MATTLPSSSSSSSSSCSFSSVRSISETPTCSFLPIKKTHHNSFSKVYFAKTLASRIVAAKAQLNKVALDSSNNVPPTPQAKSGPPPQESKKDEPSKGSSSSVPASEESISEFMSQVASLVKLVDSRDIVELQLKQLDCEILIRKKEAIPESQTPNPTHVYTMQSPPPVVPAPAPHSSPPTPPALPAPAHAAKLAKPSLPPLKSPMSGTFYRSPAPGEPPFVKVGDKVQKGQVICIIEAMKLMNEIEADQSGTVVDILAEDGKPISIDSPLLVIQP